MSSGSKQITRYGVETVIGTVASSWQVLAFTANGLDETPTTTESTSIVDSRIASGTYVTGSEITGDIETEFAYGIQDALLECVAFNPWVSDVLTFGGTNRKTLSILKGYTDIANYHVFTGCHVATWALSIPEDGIVTSVFGIMGKNRTSSSTLPAGTVTPADDAVKFTSISAGDIKIDGAPTAATMCVTQLDLTIDNTMQVQKCLDYDNNTKTIIETLMSGTGNVTVAWSAQSAALYENQFDNTPVSIEWSLKDNLGNMYTLLLPRVLLSMPLPTGGSGDILTTQGTFTVAEEAPTLTRIPVPVGP